MLRFVSNIALSNPTKPELPILKTRAVITEDDFGMAIGQNIVEQLKLDTITTRESFDVSDGTLRLVPYVGPVRVTFGRKEAFTGALNCAAGVVIGKPLAQELGMNFEPFKGDLPAAIRLLQEDSAKHIMTVENAVDPSVIGKIKDYGLSQPREDAHVAGGDPTKGYLRKDIRDSYKVHINADMGKLLKNVMYDAITKHIEPFFGVAVDWWEPPYLLLYLKDGHYALHADASRWATKPDGRGFHERSLDRDISIVLYINDDFAGGKLNFPDQSIKIEPRPGLLVAFPSTGHYKHAAEPTQDGERLAVVTWAAVKGSPRVRERPTGNRIFMNEWRKSA
jgi:predicted 2-oxoglutarate/Fe(II)-dependent dioxygenase YbiX